jgi:hypothetical protein
MHAYEIAYRRGTSMMHAYRDDLWERHVYEIHAYYERHAYKMVPVRGTPMRWPMRDARLWGGSCGKHVYERHAYGMVYGRCIPITFTI